MVTDVVRAKQLLQLSAGALRCSVSLGARLRTATTSQERALWTRAREMGPRSCMYRRPHRLAENGPTMHVCAVRSSFGSAPRMRLCARSSSKACARSWPKETSCRRRHSRPTSNGRSMVYRLNQTAVPNTRSWRLKRAVYFMTQLNDRACWIRLQSKISAALLASSLRLLLPWILGHWRSLQPTAHLFVHRHVHTRTQCRVFPCVLSVGLTHLEQTHSPAECLPPAGLAYH